MLFLCQLLLNFQGALALIHVRSLSHIQNYIAIVVPKLAGVQNKLNFYIYLSKTLKNRACTPGYRIVVFEQNIL